MKTLRTKILVMLSLCCTPIFASSSYCPQAVPTSDPTFCTSFDVSAKCFCRQQTFSWLCHSMSGIYHEMILYYGSLEKACNSQKHTDPQTCIDDWNCYRKGGRDSKGNLCSSDGRTC